MTYDVLRTGSGPRLLFLHSGFHTWVEFRRVIELLSDGYDVLATTQPGSAGGPPLLPGSPMLDQHAAYVESVLDEAGWHEEVTAVGSSFGGVLGIELLARRRVSSVIALAPPWVSGAGMPFYAAVFSAAITPLRFTRPAWRWTSRSATVNGFWFHQSRRPTELDTNDIQALLNSVARFPLYRTFLRSAPHGPGMPDPAAVESSRVTLAWGSRDFLVPHWMRKRWEAALPDAEVVQLPGFAHQPHIQDAQAIAELVRDRTPKLR